MTEHRRHPRAPIQLEVRYQRLNSFFAEYTRNISRGGLFVRTDRPLPVGTAFLFRLSLPGRAEPLEVSGEVVHAGGGAEPGMGIRFVWPDAAAREAFEREVQQLLEDSLGPEAAAALLAPTKAPPGQ